MKLLHSNDDLVSLSTKEITESFGVKAAGFVSIPLAWRPTAVFLSDELYRRWRPQRSFTVKDQHVVIQLLVEARVAVGETAIFRSSATDETVRERGKFISERVDLRSPGAAMAALNRIFTDYALAGNGRMCVIIQMFVVSKIMGFMSNEVRLVEKPYRWIVEQSVQTPSGTNVQSNGLSAKQAKIFPPTEPLICLASQERRSRLASVARYFWKEKRHRDLLEWFWDGDRLWMLQRDDATPPMGGRSPGEIRKLPKVAPIFEDGLVFKTYKVGTHTPWIKLRNLIDFSIDNNISPHRLYCALAASVEVALKDDPESLAAEIDRLTGGRAVIRCDTLSSGFNLPRSNTINGTQAVYWLLEIIRGWELNDNMRLENIAFLMHSYIPARAAAWSYYKPADATVQVDGLWGLADGMQFYPCDTYITDTQGREFSATLRFKDLVLLEQDDGTWKTDRMDERFARRRALSKFEVADIAFGTVKIAENIESDVQIMWFVDIPSIMGLGANLPWYRCTPTQRPAERQATALRATEIRSASELTKLDRLNAGSTKVILSPVGEDLRSDAFIDAVASACVRLSLPVELRGSLLGHAYHQLRSKGVEVFAAEPKKRLQEIRQRKSFQKLVRDQIPDVIRRGGETVNIDHLVASDLRVALVGKLIEEAEEFLRATTMEAAKEELADILEVLRGMSHNIGSTTVEIETIADKKRERRGGFEQGIILRTTQLQIRTPSLSNLFDDESESKSRIGLSDLPDKIRGNAILDVPIAKLLGGRPRDFSLEAPDVGQVVLSISINSGALTVVVLKGDDVSRSQPDIFDPK